jgi:hypothetical protein
MDMLSFENLIATLTRVVRPIIFYEDEDEDIDTKETAAETDGQPQVVPQVALVVQVELPNVNNDEHNAGGTTAETIDDKDETEEASAPVVFPVVVTSIETAVRNHAIAQPYLPPMIPNAALDAIGRSDGGENEGTIATSLVGLTLLAGAIAVTHTQHCGENVHNLDLS